MRVLQLVQKPQRRGAEVFAFQLSGWLRRAGHHVSTLYLYKHAGGSKLQALPGDVLFEADEDNPLEKAPGVNLRLAWEIRREIARARPDLVQVNGGRTVKYGAAAKALSPRPTWKLVYRNIGSPIFWADNGVRTRFYRYFVMPRIDGVIGVSQKTLAEVIEFYRLHVPTTFVPNGVALDTLSSETDRTKLRKHLGTPVDAPVLLFVGSMTRHKRPDRFLRVVQRVAASVPGVCGWVLGDGPERTILEEQVRGVGLDNRIQFLGYRNDVSAYIEAADLCVSTSDTEGIPAVVIEAGYLRTPTIAMQVGGIDECIRHTETGMLVPPGNEAALGHEIVQLLGDRERLQRLGEQAKAWVQERFAMEIVGPQYVNFYEQLRTL